MKYAVSFKPGFLYNDKVDEIIFDFNDPHLLEHIETYTKDWQTINIYLTVDYATIENGASFESMYLDKLLLVKNIRSDVVVTGLAYPFMTNYLEELQELKKSHNIDFIIISYPHSLAGVEELAEAGVKEIYITGDLGFELPNIKKLIAGRAGIRIYPDVNQEDFQLKNENLSVLSNFWVRPEDVSLYSEYVDTFELHHINLLQLQAIFEIYKREKWMGSIDLLISGLNTYDYNSKGSIGNNHLAPYFGENRLGCGRRCLYGDCKLCNHIEDLARAFKDAGMSINRPAKKSNLDELEEEDIKKFIKILEDAGQNKDNDPEEKTDNVS